MADNETREDIVQLTVAARDAAPDAALMRELEAIVDGGGSLLDVAEALTAGERWDALYPPSQTPAEFSDAWLETLLPGVSVELLAFGRDIVVPALDAGAGPAGLVLAAQDFLSAPGAPADFAGFAAAFLERSASAMEDLLDSEAVEDLVQLTVAAYDAAPGAALMAELEAVVDGGGSLLDAAETLTADERWTEMYPSSRSPAEFSDAWLGNLLPGADASLLAVGREVVVPHLESGESAAGLVLAAQQFLSAPGVSAPFDVFVRAFLNRAQVAAAHSVTEELDGSAAELREVLDSVTGDDATVQAAIDALDDQMPGGGTSGGGSSGGGSSGGGSGGGGSSGGGSGGGGSSGGGSSGGGSGGGGSGSGGSGSGGSSGGGSGSGGSGGGGSSGGGSSGGGSGGDGSSGDGSSGDGSSGDGSSGDGSSGDGSSGDGSSGDGSSGDGSGGDGSSGDGSGGGDGWDGDGEVSRVSVDFDDDGDSTTDRSETYTRNADDIVIGRMIELDDGSGGGTANDGTSDRIRQEAWAEGRLAKVRFDDDGDGVWERTYAYAYGEGALPDSVKYEEDADDDGSADETIEFSIIYGTDGDDAIRGTGADEWIIAGKGDDTIGGGGGRDWFIFREGDGSDSFVHQDYKPFDSGPNGEKDRIWIARGESGFDEDDLRTGSTPAANGAVYGYGGQGDKIWLPNWDPSSISTADLHRYGDAEAVPFGIGVWDVDRDASGRITDARYFDNWDGVSGFDGLPAAKVRRYSYEGAERGWKTVLMNDDAGVDAVFETRVDVERGEDGAVVSRLFEYDDGKGEGADGKTAGDGIIDRRRQDTINEDGQIVKILHDSDNDGLWNYIDTYRYEDDRPHPRARQAQRRDTQDDEDSANDRTVLGREARIVFGTDGDDRGGGKLIGSRWHDDWFLAGPGDDRVDGGVGAGDDKQGRDIHIVRYGDGSTVIQGFGPDGPAVHDTIWVLEDDFDTADVSVIESVTLTPDSDPAAHPNIPARVFPAGGEDDLKVTVLAYGGGPGDRIVLEGWDSADVDYFRERFVAPGIAYDPYAFAHGSRNEVYARDEAGRATEIRYYGAWDGIDIDARDGLEPDRTHHLSYSTVDNSDVRWRTLSEDVDGDGTVDRGTAVTWQGSTRTIASRRVTRYEDGKAVSREIDDDNDGTAERIETYTRAAAGFVSKREVEFGDGVMDGSPDRRREEVYEKGVLTEVRHDLDVDGTWDWIDTYTYPRWDTRPSVIRRLETRDNTDPSDDRTLTYNLRYYYRGSDTDNRLEGIGNPNGPNEWILAGPGDDIIRGSGGRDWFIVEEGDGEDAILDFRPSHIDRIWIREEGIGFDDLTFKAEARKNHPQSDSESDGVLISWNGEDRIWLSGRSLDTFKEDKGYILFDDEVLFVIPEDIGLEHVRDASGRTTDVRYYDGWDGDAGFGGLDPDRVHRYAYADDDARWIAASMNDDPFEDDVFETRVAVERYGNGDPVSRVFEFDDGSGGGTAGDGTVDRRRRDVFDRDGRIVEIRHDIDADGTWDHIDAVTYDASGDTGTRALLPRARSVERVSTMDDGNSANDKTADAVRLVFGTDGNDRDNAEIMGISGTDEWFVPGPGDDVVAINSYTRDADDDDVFILQYGDGRDVLGIHAGWLEVIRDRIWFLEDGFEASQIPGSQTRLSNADTHSAYSTPQLQYPLAAFDDGASLGAVFYGATFDRFLTYKYDAEGAEHWHPRFTEPEAVPHDPESFIYGSRNAAWTLDDIGRVTDIRFFDAWDGIGDPSVMKLAPDRAHRYAYNGNGTDWTTLLKNDNALDDGVFEYRLGVERDSRGRIVKETILFDDGRGVGTDGRIANDGVWDRRQENVYDASETPSRISSAKYDHDNDQTWDVRDAYTWDSGAAEGPSKVTRGVDGEEASILFIYGTDGNDAKTGTGAAEWIDAGKGDDVLTGGGGADEFIFRYGDGTDVIKDMEFGSDTIRIAEDGFDPADLDVTHLVYLGAQGDPAHPYVPPSLHSGGGSTYLSVVTYGGGPEDRIIIVGGNAAIDIRSHFAAHAGHIPDFSG